MMMMMIKSICAYDLIEPPPVRTFWNNVKELNVEVQVSKKSTYSNKEREVDQNISVDIGEEIVIHRQQALVNNRNNEDKKILNSFEQDSNSFDCFQLK
jgi:hypothetical protein